MAVPADGPCLACLYPDPPARGEVPTCNEIGVLEPAVAVTAALESAAALRFLAEGTLDGGALTQFDMWTGEFRRFRVERDPDCPVCGRKGD
jgi:adenylyltransferase/sulfurtransferase